LLHLVIVLLIGCCGDKHVPYVDIFY